MGQFISVDSSDFIKPMHPFMMECLTKYSLEEMVTYLSPFVTENRKEKIERVLQMRLSSLSVATESPTDIHNALAIVRTAEAMGVSTMHIIDHELRRKEGKGTMQGANMWSHVHFYASLEEYITMMQHMGIRVAAAVADGSSTLDSISLTSPTCFLFGNEMRGLTKEAVAHADDTFTLPMYGMTSSYNLSVAAALTLREVTQRKRQELGGTPDISAEEKLYETVVSYIRTIGFDSSEKILREMQCRAVNSSH